ncbi:MAG: sulfate reduction electron transfer complex DsrMKJOP subunit DsrM [candidate division Zixibacteria bacterium]|nr:sulfate reduction electron transfer complex DsrMKJOP subunit DsrM [candidate division Zixibacteria bacterium]
MHVISSLFILALLIGLVFLGVGVLDLQYLFGVIIPYAAITLFLAGVILKVLKWAGAPVPFRIPTTCGQQKSLSFIKADNLEAPHNIWGVLGRMILEVFFFRSLFRNTKTEIKDEKIVYGSDKLLWAAGLAFHYSFLFIFLRHFKFFAEPVPQLMSIMQKLDGFFQIGVPELFLTDIVFIGAVTVLFIRRVVIPQVRYISLPADYFPLYLILGIGGTGICMRYFSKVDIVAIKQLATGLISLNPIVPEGIGIMFFIHFFLVCVLFVYFPFSKLMHFAGVFMSPTRNLINNSRVKRHINPWNPEVKVHTYAEWEDEFREVMKDAGMPLEKE